MLRPGEDSVSPTFDPYPFGCPIGIAAEPDAYRSLLPQLVTRLMDMFFFSVHVVEPSRGQPYPLLNLLRERDRRPSVVFFPGWEDRRRRRRVDFGRQSTLLQRIHDNQVSPDRVEDVMQMSETVFEDPLLLNFAVTSPQMPHVISDLDYYLGDRMRITVQTLDAKSPMPLRIVRIYAPTDEHEPRLIAFPNWRSAATRKQDEITRNDWDELLERGEVEAAPELPIEVALDH